MANHLLGRGRFEVCAEWEGHCVSVETHNEHHSWSSTVSGAAPLLLHPAPAVCVSASAAFLPLSRYHLAHLDLCCCHLSLLLFL